MSLYTCFLCIVISSLQGHALSEVKGQKKLDGNVKTMVEEKQISSAEDKIDKGMPQSLLETMVGNWSTGNTRQCLDSTLNIAVSNRNLVEILELLDDGEDVNVKGNNGVTPLMLAAGKGNLGLVKFLIYRNASLEIKDEFDNAAIHHAAKNGNLNVLKTLLDHGGNVNDKGNMGMTPLMLAAWKGDEVIARLLVSRQANLELRNNINDAAIHIALSRRRYHVFKALVHYGANINSKGENGNTPLILASMSEPKQNNINPQPKQYHSQRIKCAEENKHLNLVKTLVDHGANVSSKNMIGRTALHEAAARGQARVVGYLLSQNASFDVEDDLCYTPLLWAANNSNIAVIKTLLEYGDDVNRRGCSNVTALHLAMERNDSELMRFLLSKSADPNVMREDGRTPLDVAFQRSLKPFIKLLLDNGARVEDESFLGSKVLFGAVANKSLELVKLLLDKTVSFETYPTVILNYAIGTKFLEGTKLLILHGANFKLKDIHGNVPLSSAVKSRSIDLVKLILENGARNISRDNLKTFLDADSNVNIFSKFTNITEVHRLSPLHIAAYLGLTDVVRLLISYSASLDVSDERKYTPLHYATEHGHIDIVKVLLDYGANKISTDINGMTPLHIACRRGLLTLVESLLPNYPTSIDLASNDGYTSLHFAAMSGSVDIVKLLLNRDANVNAISRNLTTPLHLASLEGHAEIVAILLNTGADGEASDIDGMTPLHFAARETHPKVVQLILENISFSGAKNKNGSTPIHLACGSYSRRKQLPFSKDLLLNTIRKFLEQRQIAKNSNDMNKMSELHIAARDGSLPCVELLMDILGLYADKWRNFPIHYAALNGHTAIIRMFLNKNDEERRQINLNHETPLMLASREGHTAAVALLLEGGIDDFRPDLNGRTPLHRSASRGHFEIVKLLLSSMANRDTEDKWGFTPLNYAASWRGYQDVIGYLSTSQLDITLSYYFNVSDPFQQSSANITTFFI